MLFRRKRKADSQIVRCFNHGQVKWKITGYYVGGKRVRKFFDTSGEAETFLHQLQTKQENLGTRASQIDPRLHVMALECEERLTKFGKTLLDATSFFCDYLAASERSCTVDALVSDFLDAKRLDGARPRYLGDLKTRLGKFQRIYGNRIVATIAPRECDDWLRGLRLGPQSRNNYRRVLSVLFSFAEIREYCSTNPIAKTTRAKVVSAPPEIFTPDQLKSLLASAAPDLQIYLAIGGFAGLRPAELSRLDWRQVCLDRKLIEITASNSKTATRRLVSILPTLEAWLLNRTKPAGPVRPPNLRRMLTAALTNAKMMRWPQNGLRHSFASYHLAKFQDAPALALQMGHTTTAMLFAHYREVVSPEAAEQYWQIAPLS